MRGLSSFTLFLLLGTGGKAVYDHYVDLSNRLDTFADRLSELDKVTALSVRELAIEQKHLNEQMQRQSEQIERQIEQMQRLSEQMQCQGELQRDIQALAMEMRTKLFTE
ncbi:hypothetical protein Agub_g5111 [Astrephomene gubernaculifera]|uniref:Uncharacterized protein n=1 Tax=Astrephomene gubernaculifera TaxID=47775 RepID=A0AAD3HKG2_9CHLO|nr:hypothetical protein Agub_g5111 [Astrephomene gubernaculifera]